MFFTILLFVLLAAPPLGAQSPSPQQPETRVEQDWRAVDHWSDYSPEANARRYNELVEQQFRQQLLFELQQNRPIPRAED